MGTITINIPDKYSTYIDDDSQFQNLLTEFFYDYIEMIQDNKLKKKLAKNKKFKELNFKIEAKLWNL